MIHAHSCTNFLGDLWREGVVNIVDDSLDESHAQSCGFEETFLNPYIGRFGFT